MQHLYPVGLVGTCLEDWLVRAGLARHSASRCPQRYSEDAATHYRGQAVHLMQAHAAVFLLSTESRTACPVLQTELRINYSDPAYLKKSR